MIESSLLSEKLMSQFKSSRFLMLSWNGTVSAIVIPVGYASPPAIASLAAATMTMTTTMLCFRFGHDLLYHKLT